MTTSQGLHNQKFNLVFLSDLERGIVFVAKPYAVSPIIFLSKASIKKCYFEGTNVKDEY